MLPMKHAVLWLFLALCTLSVATAALLGANDPASNQTSPVVLEQNTTPQQPAITTSASSNVTEMSRSSEPASSLYATIMTIIIVLLVVVAGAAAYYYLFMNKKQTKKTSPQQPRAHVSLQSYIADSRARGFSDAAIKNQLILSGYRKEDFEHFFK